MSFVSEVLVRADIREITEFLLYGAERKIKDNRSCEERIDKAQEDIGNWLKEKFPGQRECDEACDFIWNSFTLTSEAYLELGLTAGFLLAPQLKSETARQATRKTGGNLCRPKPKKS